MTFQRWRSRLIEELRRQGMPSKSVDRLVEELTDHAEDLLTEDQSMDVMMNLDSRMGMPEQLAIVAKAQFQRSTFAGRHPFLTFVVGPMVTLVAMIVGTFELFGMLYLLAESSSSEELSVDFKNHLFQLGSFTVQFIPFLFSTWLFVGLGRRSGRQAWSMIGFGIIVVASYIVTSTFTPRSGDVEGRWMLMLGTGTNLQRTFSFGHILQAAVPLTLGIWMYWQASRRQSLTLSAR